MEMNAANVAQHKIFPVKPSFVDKKKMDEKGRFNELSMQEIQEIMDKAVPETTKKATKFGMRLFNGTEVTSLSGRFLGFNKILQNTKVENFIKQLFHSRLLDMRLVIHFSRMQTGCHFLSCCSDIRSLTSQSARAINAIHCFSIY